MLTFKIETFNYEICVGRVWIASKSIGGYIEIRVTKAVWWFNEETQQYLVLK